MSRPRFSIASLLGIVLFAAVGTAALRAATDLWDSIIFGLALLALVVSVVLAVHRTERRRAYWLGFALFGGAYVVASLIPPIEGRLPTTKGLAYLGSKMPIANPAGVAFADYDNDGFLDLYVATQGAGNTLYVNRGNGTFQDVTGLSGIAAPSGTWFSRFAGGPTFPGGTPTNFVRIGHSLAAIVIAFLGGHFSRYLFVSGRQE
jgi:hypothetical protein